MTGIKISIWTHLNSFRVGFIEEIKQSAAEVVCMDVWISQLVGDGVEEQIASFVVQIDRQVLQNVHVSVVNDVLHRWILILRATRKEKRVTKSRLTAITEPSSHRI